MGGLIESNKVGLTAKSSEDGPRIRSRKAKSRTQQRARLDIKMKPRIQA